MRVSTVEVNKVALILGILAIVALVVFFEQQVKKTQHQLAKLCSVMGGQLLNDGCAVVSSRGSVQNREEGVLGQSCPSGQFLTGITAGGAFVCSGLPEGVERSTAKEILLNEASGVGGWRVIRMCEGEDFEKDALCRQSREVSEIKACAKDVSPAFVASGKIRYSIPVPCLDQAERCFVDEDSKSQNTKRVIYKCDEYNMVRIAT